MAGVQLKVGAKAPIVKSGSTGGSGGGATTPPVKLTPAKAEVLANQQYGRSVRLGSNLGKDSMRVAFIAAATAQMLAMKSMASGGLTAQEIRDAYIGARAAIRALPTVTPRAPAGGGPVTPSVT